MAGLVYNRTDSGLVVAEAPQGDAAVARALREYDPDLRLIPGVPGQGIPYKVYYDRGDRPAEHLCSWMDEVTGEAFPLSMGLLERVKQQDRNTRSEYLDEDERDARFREEKARNTAAALEDCRDDWLVREKHPQTLRRSVSLRQARSRTGYHG